MIAHEELLAAIANDDEAGMLVAALVNRVRELGQTNTATHEKADAVAHAIRISALEMMRGDTTIVHTTLWGEAGLTVRVHP